MPLDANIVRSIHQLQRGNYFVPADSGNGNVNRPTARGQQGGRLATFETYFDYFINNVPPPDEAKILDPDIELKIRMHADVAGAHTKRSFTVSRMPWRVEPNPEGPNKAAADEVASHCRRVMKNLPNHHLMIETLQNAVMNGGQGLEYIWHREANGVEYPVQHYPVHMSRFLFDRLGNMALLTRDNAVWGVYVSTDPQARYSRMIPRGKMLYYIYRQGQGSWEKPQNEGYVYYGFGEDIALYYVITFDVFCLKFRMKFLERYGIPPTVLYHPENRSAMEVLRIADSLRGESVITVPRLMGSSATFDSLYKVDQLPVPSSSYDFFESFSNRYTLPRINTILLGSAEENGKGEEGGSYSDHVSRRDSGPNIYFGRDAMGISQAITAQLMPAIALGRYPNLPPEYFPIYTLEPKEEKDRLQELQIAEQASKLVPIPEDHIYDAADLPKPKIDSTTQQMEKTVGGAQQGDPDGMGMMTAPDGNPEALKKLVGERTPVGGSQQPKDRSLANMGKLL